MTDHRTDRTLAKPGRPLAVDDGIIDAMVEGLDWSAEAADADAVRGDAEDAPFDLGMPAPRAIDLRKLWKLAGKEPDPQFYPCAPRLLKNPWQSCSGVFIWHVPWTCNRLLTKSGPRWGQRLPISSLP